MKATITGEESLRIKPPPGPLSIEATVPLARFPVAPRYTLIYDGECEVCTASVQLLTKWDRNHELELIPSQTPGVCERFPWIPSRAYVESIQVVRTSDGRTWQAAAALEELLNVLPRGRLVSWLFRIPFVRPLADKFYAWFARNRYTLGCGEHCAVREANLDYGEG